MMSFVTTSGSSLPLLTDSVDIIFQHRPRLDPLYYISAQAEAGFSLLFQQKKSVVLIFHLDFVQNLQSFMFCWAIIRKLQLTWQNANIRLCTYPLLTLVRSLRPTALMPIVLKHFVYSILHTGFR